MGNHWTLQDAGNAFSAVVEAARNGEPQHVSNDGVDAVVVLSAEEYRRLAGPDVKKPKRTFKEHLLDFPRLPEGMDDIFDKPEPLTLEMNEVDFSE